MDKPREEVKPAPPVYIKPERIGAPPIHIEQEILHGIRKALEDLHKTGGSSFHLSFVVDDKGKIGDAHFTIE